MRFGSIKRGKPEAGDEAVRTRRFERTPTTPAATGDLDSELDALVEILSRGGEHQRKELRTLAGAESWGPGRFGRALELGVLSGRIRRTGRDRYAVGGGA